MLSKKKISVLAVVTVLFFTVACSAYLRSLLSGLPSISSLEDYTPSLVTRIYDCKGNLVTELFTERRTLTPLKEIPVDLQNAIISIEDNDFFKHWGVSPKGIARAALNNVVRRRVAQGGSTITQQLAKTIFLTPERNINRKLKELLLTVELERNYSKEEIFQLYLNQIYFGSGAYGVESAAKIYFSKHVKDLNLAECALLAGLPQAPGLYDPFTNPDLAKQRQQVVLGLMETQGYITRAQLAAAEAAPLSYNPAPYPIEAPHFIWMTMPAF